MSNQSEDQPTAAREEQFLALLRAGISTGGNARGLFDAPSPDQHEQLLRVRPAPLPPEIPATGIGTGLAGLVWYTAWRVWRFTRQLSGDDAYERYLEHVARFHPGEAPMTRAAHYRFRQDAKWNRLTRCC